jgi:hypothetical protein
MAAVGRTAALIASLKFKQEIEATVEQRNWARQERPAAVESKLLFAPSSSVLQKQLGVGVQLLALSSKPTDACLRKK